jgi:hypothetical protein
LICTTLSLAVGNISPTSQLSALMFQILNVHNLMSPQCLIFHPYATFYFIISDVRCDNFYPHYLCYSHSTSNSFFCSQFSHCLILVTYSRYLYLLFHPISAFLPIVVPYSARLNFVPPNFRNPFHACGIFYIVVFLYHQFSNSAPFL